MKRIRQRGNKRGAVAVTVQWSADALASAGERPGDSGGHVHATVAHERVMTARVVGDTADLVSGFDEDASHVRLAQARLRRENERRRSSDDCG